MAESLILRAVVFRVGDLVCALPAGLVREILPILPATRIPGVAAAVEGLVNVRGQLLTVIDGHSLLERARPLDDEGAIVMLDLAGRLCGLAVSAVLDFVEVPEASIAPRAELPGVDPRLVQAVGPWLDQHFVLLDADTLLAPMIGSSERASG